MLTACTLQSQQVWGALSQVTTLVNNLRTTAHGVIQRSHLSAKPTDKVTRPCIGRDTGPHLTVESLYEIIQTLPKDCPIKELFPLDKRRYNVSDDWSKSIYTSANTFFENKTGFRDDDIFSRHCFTLASNILSSHNFQHVFNSISKSQTRGFKTHRGGNPSHLTASKSKGRSVLDEIRKSRVYRQTIQEILYAGNLGMKPRRTPTIDEQVSDRLTGNKETPTSNKLKHMLHDASPDLQEKLKLAFAEGYAAHGKSEPEQKNTIGHRVLKFVYVLAFLWLITQAIQILGGLGSGGVGGLGVLNRDRYEINPEEIHVNFNDVKGVDEAKQELQDIVDFLRDPDKFTSLGAKLPRGVLLVGKPGIGKTLLARAVAGEAGVPFFQASGSEFDEMFVGTGAKRVRQLFAAAKARTPCVIFIDEIDTVGAKRTNSQIHPYANQTINQLLSEMDGFKQNEGVIVLGATNRRDNLDKALLRPGRFDVEVQVASPDVKGRKEILEYYLDKIVSDESIDVDKIAHGTGGFTGADLENMVNQAALKAAMDYSTVVTIEHLDFARDKVLMGPAKKSKIPDEDTNWVTAYHEAGHTIVAYFTKHSTPLHKCTIMPRGSSLGHTAFIPDHEIYNHTKIELLAHMDVSLGGRIGEEVIYGNDKITTGAGNDFQNATAIATSMVKKWGMSDKVGVRVFGDSENDQSLSPAIREQVDAEIKRILQESYERARNVIKSHSSEHRALAQALMKYETLDFHQISTILEGGKL